MSKKRENCWKNQIMIIGAILGGLYVIMRIIVKKRVSHNIDEGNPYLTSSKKNEIQKLTIYERKIKPMLDRGLSFAALVLLSPLFVLISVAIYLDDPGSIFFTQTRVGKDKRFFCLHKFRSMKMSTPHDVPTHQLVDPEQYITRVGRILRKTSLDELPQIWDIFCGKMSIIGPRPALWNQKDLVEARDQYFANTCLPGLTGLAQIRGRDELEIPLKAKYDGEYVATLRQGGISAFLMDVKCFLGTIGSVLKSEGIVEGGTGELRKRKEDINVEVSDAGLEDYGYRKKFCVDTSIDNQKKILITGANSYIGESFRLWAKEHYSQNFIIDTLDMIDGSWREFDFSSYDCVFHVAGIAHADVGHVSDKEKARYYSVNTELAIETAQKAKADGVSQFVFMSSMIIYGESAPYGKKKIVDEHTIPAPSNFYGDSKWRADKGVRELSSPDFHVTVLRPPMIYGRGSKGNYPVLAKLAKRLLVFPAVDNERSMLYIDNLCEFLCKIIFAGEGGIYFPQNAEYSNTCLLVKEIGNVFGKNICMFKLLNPMVTIASHIPGKIGALVNKAFGNIIYSQKLSIYDGLDYQVSNFRQSIFDTERAAEHKNIDVEHKLENLKGKRVLLIALTGYSTGIIKKMQELGAEVDYINDKPNNGVVSKVLGRLKIGCYQKFLNNYYMGKLEKLKYRNYDFILVIRGEYTPEKILKCLKNYYPNSKLILYMWDGLHKFNTRGIEKKWPLYDKVYTFDRFDYETHKDKISFLPLYYYEEYLPKDITQLKVPQFKYDLSFIGTGHDDRIRIVKEVMEQCKERGLSCYSYFFVPHQLIYIYNKLFNRNFRNVYLSDVTFEMMPFEKLYKLYANSKCIMDVENKKQHGLTMRSIEMLGLRRKFMTTNKDIVNYDFYNSNNILVIDRKNPKLDMSFLEKPYEILDECIYQKYSLSNWILEVLK